MTSGAVEAFTEPFCINDTISKTVTTVMDAIRDPKQNILNSVFDNLVKEKAELNKRIRELFQAHALENRYPLHPRRLVDLACEEAEFFLTFLAAKQTEDVFSHGGKGVIEGLADKTILALCGTLQDFCWDILSKKDSNLLYAAICAVERYVVSYVEGFMAEREIQILRDQEQMRRALSAALERQRRELYVKDHAINTSINGIIITDLEGRLTYVNPAFLVMWGYNGSDKVIGKNYIEFVKSEESQKQITSSAIRKKGGWRGEMILQRDDGSSVEIEVSVSSILDAAGNPLGNMVSFTDISDRKRLEAEFRQAQKMEALNTLAGGIAHDFNNLLTTVLGNTSLMLMDIKPTHPHYERLKIIESQVESGSKLTKQLLGYARKGKYEVKPINLNRLVLETSETFGRTRKEVTIYRELDEDLVAIEADSGQIEQVLLNLYINAADAMAGGGELVLRTRSVILQEAKLKHSVIPPGKYVTLSVADTGMGMDTNTIERIFDPFFTTKEMGRGVGLGLASAYGIIKNHGGYIDVKSSKGTGTTFVIYLPASDKEEMESTRPVEQVWKGREAILMVDDEEPVLDISVKLLKTMGYTVFAARSGREALGIYQTEKDRIALVILDMIMPMMGGGDTYEKLKQINPNVKVLLASGYSIDGQASQILTRGCNGFIQKPFKLGELSKKIRTVLDDN